MIAGIPTQRVYQDAASQAVEAAFFEAGQNRLLVKKPTGTGKTVWFAGLLKRLAPWLETFKARGEQRGATMLVIAHREELLDQAAEKITRANKGLIVTIEQGDRHASRYSDVVVASIQTLQAMKFKRLLRLLKHHTFRIVIVDEAHHAAAKSYRTALAMLGFLPKADITEGQDIEAATHDDVLEMEQALASWDEQAPKDRVLIGVTATPNRSDAVGLGCVFQSIAYSYPLKQAIEDGWLTPIVPWVVETATSLDNVHMARGDFNQRELAEAVNNDPRNAMGLAAWREHADGLPTIGFTVDVAHAHALADLYSNAGIRAVAISGETPKEERRILLRQYREGQVTVIFNCMVLTEGTDLPLTACILHYKPTSSATLYEQMTGRGLRTHPDDPAGPARLEAIARGDRIIKPDCIVIDLVDVARRHSLMAAPVLYGLPPSLVVKGKEMRQVERELQEILDRHPGLNIDGARLTLEQLRAKASTFDIWNVNNLGAFGAGRALNWIRAGAEDFRLIYPWADGTETLQVVKDMLGHYEVICTLRPRDGAGPPRQRTLATQVVSADAAAGLAEAFVLQERRSTMKIMGKDEPWRLRPATPKQLGRLRMIGAPIKKGMTAGEASTLIDQFTNRRGGR